MSRTPSGLFSTTSRVPARQPNVCRMALGKITWPFVETVVVSCSGMMASGLRMRKAKVSYILSGGIATCEGHTRAQGHLLPWPGGNRPLPDAASRRGLPARRGEGFSVPSFLAAEFEDSLSELPLRCGACLNVITFSRQQKSDTMPPIPRNLSGDGTGNKYGRAVVPLKLAVPRWVPV